jgi:hypothetical protein
LQYIFTKWITNTCVHDRFTQCMASSTFISFVREILAIRCFNICFLYLALKTRIIPRSNGWSLEVVFGGKKRNVTIKFSSFAISSLDHVFCSKWACHFLYLFIFYLHKKINMICLNIYLYFHYPKYNGTVEYTNYIYTITKCTQSKIEVRTTIISDYYRLSTCIIFFPTIYII